MTELSEEIKLYVVDYFYPQNYPDQIKQWVKDYIIARYHNPDLASKIKDRIDKAIEQLSQVFNIDRDNVYCSSVINGMEKWTGKWGFIAVDDIKIGDTIWSLFDSGDDASSMGTIKEITPRKFITQWGRLFKRDLVKNKTLLHFIARNHNMYFVKEKR